MANNDRQAFQWQLDATGDRVLELPKPTSTFSKVAVPTRDSLSDLLANAFSSAIEFPPLIDCLVADDSIAIAIDPNLRNPKQIVETIVAYLRDKHVRSENMTVVLQASCESIAEQLRNSDAVGCNVLVHNPDEQTELAYLAADDDAQPIYVNRVLVESDVVLPVVEARPIDSFAYAGLSGIVPHFVDTATAARWRTKVQAENLQSAIVRDARASEIAFLLGCQFSLVLELDAFGQPLQYLFGDPSSIAKRFGTIESASDHDSVAELKAEERPSQDATALNRVSDFDLVVMSIEPPTPTLDWEHFSRAIYLAKKYAGDEAAIAVVMPKLTTPTGTLRHLASREDDDDILKKLLSSSAAERSQALLLFELRSQHRIVLLSDTPSDLIEQLGIGILENKEQLRRLIESNDRVCYVTGLVEPIR
jgi:hypothetical protein